MLYEGKHKVMGGLAFHTHESAGKGNSYISKLSGHICSKSGASMAAHMDWNFDESNDWSIILMLASQLRPLSEACA